MFENFPYTDFHQLNLDWIIKIAKDFLDQYTHIQEIITEGENSILQKTSDGIDSLEQKTTDGLSQLQTKADNLETLLNEWYTTHSSDIANQLADALADLNSWYTEHTNYLNEILQTNIAAFNTHAAERGAEVIASIPADYTSLENDVRDLQEGNYPAGSIQPAAIQGIHTVDEYIADILYNKAIGISGGRFAIIDSAGNNVVLYKKGKGFVGATDNFLTVDSSTLALDLRYTANNLINLATLASDRYVAITESTLIKQDFNYFDTFLPYYQPKIKIPSTLVGTLSYTDGISRYNSSIRAFFPFRYTGTICYTGMTGYTMYNTDGTYYQGNNISGDGYIDVNDKIITFFSDDIDNASIGIFNDDKEYSNKLCCVFGDSLTADAPYYPYLRNITRMAIKNCGMGGTRVSGSGDTCFWQDVRINALEGDIIVIMGGTNDCRYADPGTASLENTDTDTFFGAYNVMLSKILYRYGCPGYYQNVDYSGVTQIVNPPVVNIILVTPPKLLIDDNSFVKSQEFGGYVKTIGAWWGLPVVDAWSEMQMNKANKNWFFAAGDYAHYNMRGRTRLAALIANEINKCCINEDIQKV